MFASLEGRELKTGRDYDAFAQKYDTVMENVYQITALSRSIAENKSEITKLEGQVEALQPWLGLELSMRFKGTGPDPCFYWHLTGRYGSGTILTGWPAKSRAAPCPRAGSQFLSKPDLRICPLSQGRRHTG